MLPHFQVKWNARQGAQELYEAYKRNNVTLEEFQSRRYVRLKQFEHLLATHQLDDTLRWQTKA